MHLLSLHTHGSKLGPKSLYMKSFSFFSKLAFIIPNTRATKRIGPHNEDIISLLVGGLLGDIHAERNLNGGVRFRFKQSVIHKDYIYFLYRFLLVRGYCNNTQPIIKTHKGFSYLTFDTYSFTSLLWLYHAFYAKNRIKSVPYNIAELLSPLALAVWIMDDGGKHNTGLRLATHCFMEKDVDLLIEALKNKFGLISTRQKNNDKFIIYISASSMNTLRQLVTPYMCSSMLYKLGM